MAMKTKMATGTAGTVTWIAAWAAGLVLGWQVAAGFAASETGKGQLTGIPAKTSVQKGSGNAGTTVADHGNGEGAGLETNDSQVTNTVETSAGKNSRTSVGAVVPNRSVIGKSGGVVNRSTVDNSSAGASGGATVHMGTIMIEDVVIDGQLGNDAKIRDSESIAEGEGSTANAGMIDLTSGTVGKNGVVANKVVITGSRNVAMGKNNTASMGTVNGSGSSIDGKVENKSQVDSTVNLASGEDNTGAVGTTQVENSRIGKAALLQNTTDTKKTANIGLGIGNKTSAASVQVE